MIEGREVFTIGHSNHSIERFIELLRQHRVTAVADVRSVPFSRNQPQFNREGLIAVLRRAEIAYVFLGDELGGRTKDQSCYEKGRVQYRKLAMTESFHRGMERLSTGAQTFRVALLCAEREPLNCHRALLVGRALDELGSRVLHIHADGRLEDHRDAIRRLVKTLNLPESDLFLTDRQLIDNAYANQEERIAFRLGNSSTLGQGKHD